MKIIFSEPGDKIAEHARKLVVKKQSDEPRGVAHYSAKIPAVCEDCGETYWHGNDPYVFYPHSTCKGKQTGAGF